MCLFIYNHSNIAHTRLGQNTVGYPSANVRISLINCIYDGNNYEKNGNFVICDKGN